MITIAIINRKGGVGKTATAHNLGAGLRRKKYKVLYIDLDSQMNLTMTIGADAEKGASDMLLCSGLASDYITETENGDIIAADPTLAQIDAKMQEVGKEYRLRECLESVQSKYDFCVIDTPAYLSLITINALTACNEVLIPMRTDSYSVAGLSQLLESVGTIRQYTNPAIHINGLLVTQYKSRPILSRDTYKSIQTAARDYIKDGCICYEPIRDCIAVSEAQAMKKDIFAYAPKSNASQDYKKFVEQFLKSIKK